MPSGPRRMLGSRIRAPVVFHSCQPIPEPVTAGVMTERPPFNADQVDGTGRKRYQSVVPDATINALSEGVNTVDAILYTNFVGGGLAACESGYPSQDWTGHLL